MELNEIKNWSYDKLDKSISFNKNEISRLKNEIKMLREVKSQKTMADSLTMITDFGIDFSLADLQAFLKSKKNAVVDKETQTEVSVAEEVAPEEKSTQDDSIAQEQNSDDFLKTSGVGEDTTEENSKNAFGGEESAEDIFEDAVPDVTSRSITYKTITQNLGLPENASVAEIRQAFDVGKNSLPPAFANDFGEKISKMERGEIV